MFEETHPVITALDAMIMDVYVGGGGCTEGVDSQPWLLNSCWFAVFGQMVESQISAEITKPH